MTPSTPLSQPIVVVSGLPRSGTSLMMQMLVAGGIEPVTDGLRQADADNPRGYFEHEGVKKLRETSALLHDAPGKAVKVIHALLRYLPPQWRYDVIFMQRDIAEVLRSQLVMLQRSGKTGPALAPEKLMAVFTQQVQDTLAWVNQQPGMRLHVVAHREILQSPRSVAHQVQEFLGRSLNLEAMARAVDPGLYRHRS